MFFEDEEIEETIEQAMRRWSNQAEGISRHLKKGLTYRYDSEMRHGLRKKGFSLLEINRILKTSNQTNKLICQED